MSNQQPNPDEIRAALAERFPGSDAADLIESAYLANYPLPPWSTLDKPMVHTDKTANAGAFVLAYYVDPSRTDPLTHRRGEVMVVLNRRGKEKTADGKPMYAGTGGGFRELGGSNTAGEQPDENAARELREETVDDQGTPILEIATNRLKLFKAGVDYRRPHKPVDYVGYSVALTKEEYEAIGAHGERLRNEPEYLEAVKKHSEGEVAGYEAMPLSQARRLSRDQFAHPHEFDALHELDAMLKQQPALGFGGRS